MGWTFMTEMAVDVVLMPDDEMTNIVIGANKKLLEKNPDKIVLGRESCLPHISLAMGCIEQKQLADIGVVLRKIAGEFSIGSLCIVGVHTHTNVVGEKVSALRIENTNLLRSLHEQVMTSMKPYFSYDVTEDMVLSDGEVGESTLLWIKNYPAQSSYEKFFPHITLGYGEILFENLPIDFTVTKIALCHLGNHCTCRKVLAAAELTA